MAYYRVRRTGEQIQNGTELYHHGILGQKWGVRRFQNKDGTLTRAGEKRYGVGDGDDDSVSKSNIKRLNSATNNRSSSSTKSENPLLEKWNSLDKKTQDRIKAGAALAATALVAYGAYSIYKYNNGVIEFISPDYDSINKVETDNVLIQHPILGRIPGVRDALELSFSAISFDSGSDDQKILDPKTIRRFTDIESGSKSLQHSVNPAFSNAIKKVSGGLDKYKDPNGDLDYKKLPSSMREELISRVGQDRLNNCFQCTTAYDLGRRGFAVKANNSTHGGTLLEILEMYNITDPRAIFKYDSRSKNPKKLIRTCEEFGEGARGNIMVSFKGGGSHSMAWEVINGKLNIIDCQVGKRYVGNDQIKKIIGSVKGLVEVARTDNSDPIWDEALLRKLDYAD